MVDRRHIPLLKRLFLHIDIPLNGYTHARFRSMLRIAKHMIPISMSDTQ